MSAGLDYYDNRNKVESTLLGTVYVAENLGKYGTSYAAPIMKYTRTRTKTYSYVGLNKETAKRCVADKQAQYTRTYFNWYQSNGIWRQKRTVDGMYKELVAGVQASKRDGSLWDVEIQVNEVAIVYTLGESIDLDQTFRAYLGDWDYDED